MPDKSLTKTVFLAIRAPSGRDGVERIEAAQDVEGRSVTVSRCLIALQAQTNGRSSRSKPSERMFLQFRYGGTITRGGSH